MVKKSFLNAIRHLLQSTCFSFVCISMSVNAMAEEGHGLRGDMPVENNQFEEVSYLSGLSSADLRGADADHLQINRSHILRLFTSNGDWRRIDHEFKIRLDRTYTSTLGEPEDSDVTGLRGAVEASLAKSFDLSIALKSAEISNTNIWSAIAAFTPTLSASYSHSMEKAKTDTDIAQASVAGLTLTMPIYSGGARLFNLAAAKDSALSSHYSALAVIDQVQLGTVQSYVQIISAQKSLEIYKSGVEHAKSLYNATLARQKSGFASPADLSLVRANLSAAQRNFEQAKSELQQTKIVFKARTGQDAQLVAHHLNLDKYLKNGLDDLISNARSNNPNLRAANANYTAQKNITRASYGKFLPQVNLQAKYEYYIDKPYNGDLADTDRWSAGIQLTVPLINFANVAESIKQRQQTDIAILSEAKALHGVETDLKGLWADYQALGAMIIEAEKEKKARLHVFSAISGQYKEGFTSIESLVDADQNAQNAALMALKLIAQRDIIAAQMLTISGQFKPSMLRR